MLRFIILPIHNMPYFKHAGLYLQNGKDNCYAIARRGWGAVVAFLNYMLKF